MGNENGQTLSSNHENEHVKSVANHLKYQQGVRSTTYYDFFDKSIFFCIARRFGRRPQPIFRQFVNLINHNKYNDTLDEI